MGENSKTGLYEWLQTIVIGFLIFVVVVTFVGRRMTVQGISMEPSYVDGDQMIVRSILYTPARGDTIVLAKRYAEGGTPMVKRIIALAGDVVDIDTDTGLVSVNGQILDEPYTKEPTYTGRDTQYPFTVPAGSVFVMGDNRNISLDSRSTMIGPVDTREIIGKVVAVIYPLNRIGLAG